MNYKVFFAIPVVLVLIGFGMQKAPVLLDSVGVAGKLQSVVIVEETAERTAAQRAVIYDQIVRDQLAKKGVALHVVDKDVTGPDLAEIQPALDAAAGKKLPQEVFIKSSGKPVVKALPVTPEENRKLVTAQGG